MYGIVPRKDGADLSKYNLDLEKASKSLPLKCVLPELAGSSKVKASTNMLDLNMVDFDTLLATAVEQ